MSAPTTRAPEPSTDAGKNKAATTNGANGTHAVGKASGKRAKRIEALELSDGSRIEADEVLSN